MPKLIRLRPPQVRLPVAARDEDHGVVEQSLRERARQGVLRVVGDDRVEALTALLPRHRGFFMSVKACQFYGLTALDLAFFLSKKSSDTLDWLFLFNPTLAGDYENTDKDAFNYLTIAGAKWKQSENLQWIFGAVYTTGIGDDLFVPAIGLIWEPSDRSSFVFAGPIIRYSYQLSDSLALKLGGQFVGNRWNTEATYGGSLEERNVRYRSYRVSANLQWSFDDHHSVFAGAGYDFAGEFEIESPSLNTDRDVENGGVFEIGYQYQF